MRPGTAGLEHDDAYDPMGSPDPRDQLQVQHRAAFDAMCEATKALDQAVAARDSIEPGSPAAAEATAAFDKALASVVVAVKEVERIGGALARAASPPTVPEGESPRAPGVLAAGA